MKQFFKSLFSGGKNIQIKALISNGAMIIDVRTQAEYLNGHLKTSVNIPLAELSGSLSKLDKSKVVITCCATGMRSASAKNILLTSGFSEVYNGGSWKSLQKFES